MIADILYRKPSRLSKRHSFSCPQILIADESNSRKYKPRSSSLAYYTKEQFVSAIQNRQEQKSDCKSSLDNDDYQCSLFKKTNVNSNSTFSRRRGKSLANSFSLSEISEFASDNLSTCTDNNPMGTANASSPGPSTTNWLQRLPPGDTTWLDDDNIFLLFVCVSILLAHRTILLKQTNLDEQEISMHFDRYRRRHSAERILLCARALYAQYIQWARKKRMLDDLNRFSAS